MKEVFSTIYHNNLWEGTESVSGPGSGVARTSELRVELVALLKQIKARSILDAACGDFNWMKETSFDVDEYIGVDIVPELIAANSQRYANTSRRFVNLDIARDELPKVDVILCRDCLVHFSFEHIAQALANFKRSGSTFLLTTTFVQFPDNEDIATGGWRQLNLEIAPFNFPKPVAMIDEKCLHTGGIYADKRLALWRLEDLQK